MKGCLAGMSPSDLGFLGAYDLVDPLLRGFQLKQLQVPRLVRCVSL